MVSSEHRFHGLTSLRFVYRQGTVVRGPYFGLKYSYNKRRSSYRVAVVVSKKVSKSAVQRNRIRRRLFEAVRELQPHINGPYDIVLLVHSEKLASMPASTLQAAVKKQLTDAGIL